MALTRCLLVVVQYAVALDCARRPAIAQLTAAATGCVAAGWAPGAPPASVRPGEACFGFSKALYITVHHLMVR